MVLPTPEKVLRLVQLAYKWSDDGISGDHHALLGLVAETADLLDGPNVYWDRPYHVPAQGRISLKEWLTEHHQDVSGVLHHKPEQLGETTTYPTEKGWDIVSTIPKSVAVQWVLETVPTACVTGERGRIIADYPDRWLNKLAVTVEVNPTSTKQTALYNHDGTWYIIQKQIR